VDITYTPIFLGGVMHACDNKPPVEIKNKAKWINIERERWAKTFNIPMMKGSPKPFPQLTVNTMRAVCAVSLLAPQKLEDVIAALYHTFWVESKPVSKPEVYGPVIASVVGEDLGKQVMEKSKTPEAKHMLKKNTDLALEKDAFGLPWYVATNRRGEEETFWGFDHLGQVADFLEVERKGNGSEGFRAML
jgi:2-hydroxychromene-2-carboxylate isomerase